MILSWLKPSGRHQTADDEEIITRSSSAPLSPVSILGNSPSLVPSDVAIHTQLIAMLRFRLETETWRSKHSKKKKRNKSESISNEMNNGASNLDDWRLLVCLLCLAFCFIHLMYKEKSTDTLNRGGRGQRGVMGGARGKGGGAQGREVGWWEVGQDISGGKNSIAKKFEKKN